MTKTTNTIQRICVGLTAILIMLMVMFPNQIEMWIQGWIG